MSMANETMNLSEKDDTNFFVRVVRYFIPWKGDGAGEVFRKIVFMFSSGFKLHGNPSFLDFTFTIKCLKFIIINFIHIFNGLRRNCSINVIYFTRN
jgi:hypothetical protein